MSAEQISTQLAWLKADLAAVDRKATPWVLAYSHKNWDHDQARGWGSRRRGARWRTLGRGATALLQLAAPSAVAPDGHPQVDWVKSGLADALHVGGVDALWMGVRGWGDGAGW